MGSKVQPTGMLDGAAATVPNAKLSQVACDSQEIESPETKQPA